MRRNIEINELGEQHVKISTEGTEVVEKSTPSKPKLGKVRVNEGDARCVLRFRFERSCLTESTVH